MSYQASTILVTGAAGFIGCNFVRMMLNRYDNINIISFDKLTYAGSLDNLSDVTDYPNHQFIQGDICDGKVVLKILRKHGVDTIVHFAAESHVDNSIADPKVFFETNVMGTLSLLEAAKQFWLEEKNWNKTQCRFHHVSTDEVYGTLGKTDPAFTETKRYEPNSPYSASKAGSDYIVRAYYHTYKLPVTLSNCSNNYGPHQHTEKLIPMIIKSCLNQKTLPVYGDGSNIRDWLYVEDHCDAIDFVLQKGTVGEMYNVGGKNEIDNLTLIKMICQMMNKIKPGLVLYEQLIDFVIDRQGHDWRYAIDNTKIERELGWRPPQNFEQKLRKTVEYYLEYFK